MTQNINDFFKIYDQKMNEPIVKQFLQEKNNYSLLISSIDKPTKENKNRLDTAFKNHYKKVKIVNYLSKLIYFFAIDFDKKISNHRKKNVLNMDSDTSFTDRNKLIKESTSNIMSYKLEINEKNSKIVDIISDEEIITNIKNLSDKQIRILELKYINNFSNKEISKFLNESEQTISYNLRKALNKLRDSKLHKRDV